MSLHKVKSSAVKAMGFDHGIMTVQYKSGGTYKYKGESKSQYDKVLHASSVGKSLAKLLGIHSK